MANAKQDGVYTLNGGRFLIRKGDALPDGAEMAETGPSETPEAVETATPVETKKAKTGPSETTEAAAPAVETA